MDHNFKRYIQNSSLFRHIDTATLDEVVDLFQYQRLLRGETLFKVNEPGDAFYIVLSGRLQVCQHKPVAELLPGDSFGELALISDKPRSATIKAQRDSELGKLQKLHFEMILKHHPEIAVEIIKVMGGWLDPTERDKSFAARNVVTFVELGKQQPHQNLLAKCVAELQTHGATHLITPGQLDKPFFRRGNSPDHEDFCEQTLARWIAEQEQANNFILLQCRAEPSRWRDFCLRQADRILCLAAPNTPHENLDLIQLPELLPEIKWELVLVHADNVRRPENTNKWLKHGMLSRHHHIRWENQKDIARLCREIANKAHAVVLGGGGARSFAQIGVLKAMEELGLGIDHIAGTSMGAIIAAQYADGHSPDDILAMNNEIWVRNQPHKEFTLPVSSLLTAGKAKRLTQEVFGERHIGDLWLPFFCMSSDLTKLAACRHENGEIWSALLASGAIPGICSSIISNEGSLLVDGGVIDNLPVRGMREKHNGPVIAVDVATDKGLLPHWQETIPPNGLRALWHHLNPWRKTKPHPHIFKLFTHTATLASKMNSEQSRKLADLCITPDCKGHGLMQMDNLGSLMQRGYESAMPVLEDWLNGSE